MTTNGERTICDVLTDLLIEQRHMNEMLAELVRNTSELAQQQSSVEIKFLASGVPQPVVKVYSGSAAPVEEALDAYARTFVAAERGHMDGWQKTLDQQRAKQHKSIFGSEETGTAYDLPVSHRA